MPNIKKKHQILELCSAELNLAQLRLLHINSSQGFFLPPIVPRRLYKKPEI